MKMEKRKKFWLYLGVALATILLLWWLFAATLITEDENESVQDVFEQTN